MLIESLTKVTNRRIRDRSDKMSTRDGKLSYLLSICFPFYITVPFLCLFCKLYQCVYFGMWHKPRFLYECFEITCPTIFRMFCRFGSELAIVCIPVISSREAQREGSQFDLNMT